MLNNDFFQNTLFIFETCKKFFQVSVWIHADNFGTFSKTPIKRFWEKFRVLFNKSFKFLKSTVINTKPISVNKISKKLICFDFIVYQIHIEKIIAINFGWNMMTMRPKRFSKFKGFIVKLKIKVVIYCRTDFIWKERVITEPNV